MRVDGRHENRIGRCVDRRHLAVGAGAQRGPQTGLLEILTHLGLADAVQLGARILREGQLVVAFEINHHRLQHTPFTAMNRADDACAWRGEVDARRLLVGEQDLPQLHSITNLGFHGRLHAGVIEPYYGDASHRPAGLYTLRRRPCDGQIEPTFYIDHRFA